MDAGVGLELPDDQHRLGRGADVENEWELRLVAEVVLVVAGHLEILPSGQRPQRGVLQRGHEVRLHQHLAAIRLRETRGRVTSGVPPVESTVCRQHVRRVIRLERRPRLLPRVSGFVASQLRRVSGKRRVTGTGQGC